MARQQKVITALYKDDQERQQVLFAAPSPERYDQIAKALGYKPDGNGYYLNSEGHRLVPDDRMLVV